MLSLKILIVLDRRFRINRLGSAGYFHPGNPPLRICFLGLTICAPCMPFWDISQFFISETVLILIHKIIQYRSSLTSSGCQGVILSRPSPPQAAPTSEPGTRLAGICVLKCHLSSRCFPPIFPYLSVNHCISVFSDIVGDFVNFIQAWKKC